MPKASSKSNRKSKASTSKISGFFTVLSNLFSIGITAATSTTAALASDAANTASEYTVKPFNSLVKSATQRYFAPQITYSSYSVRWALPGTGRKRSATEEVVFARPHVDGLPRRNSLAKPQTSSTGLGRTTGPPRSSSVPVLCALDIQDIATRRRRPTLLPINTNVPRVSFPRSDTSPSPLSTSSFSNITESGGSSSLATPMLGVSFSSASDSGSSMPSTPRLGCPPRQASPLCQAQPLLYAETSEGPSPIGASKYSKSLPIARFSFWNLVGMSDGGNDQLRTPRENEEEEAEEEPESYRRLCYI